MAGCHWTLHDLKLIKDKQQGITDSCACMCLCYFMQQIDKIVKYIDTEEVRENIIDKTYKHNKFNKDFT